MLHRRKVKLVDPDVSWDEIAPRPRRYAIRRMTRGRNAGPAREAVNEDESQQDDVSVGEGTPADDTPADDSSNGQIAVDNVGTDLGQPTNGHPMVDDQQNVTDDGNLSPPGELMDVNNSEDDASSAPGADAATNVDAPMDTEPSPSGRYNLWPRSNSIGRIKKQRTC